MVVESLVAPMQIEFSMSRVGLRSWSLDLQR